MKRRLCLILLICLCLIVFSGCGTNSQSAPQAQPHGQAPSHEVVLSSCSERLPSPSITNSLSASDTHVLYFGSRSNLYTFKAGNGVMLWCKQARITGNFPCPGHCPPPPFVIFGEPAVVGGVVYVCASGYGGYTYALRARDGSLLWRVKSDCAFTSIPFADYAVPLVDHDIVYTGAYALRAKDGKVLWHTSTGVAFQALVDGVLYANSEEGIYALRARDGAVLWRYEAPDRASVGGRLVVASKRVYFGTLDSVDQTEKSALYVLNSGDGSLLWKFSMGAYSGATLLNDLVYVSSRDQYLYALQASNGAVRWRYRFIYPTYNTATGINGVLSINIDGVYALNAATGQVIWHQSLGADQSVYFTPSTVVGNVLYLARMDGQGQGILYALNASTGTIYWQVSGLDQLTPLTAI